MSFRILSSTEGVSIGAGMLLRPFLRYVLPAGPAQSYALQLQKQGIDYTMSVFNAYQRPYGGVDLNGKRLAFYRHTAFGDQLMATAVPVYLKHLYPDAKIDVYCSPEVMPIWRGLPVRCFEAPITFEAARAYDYHLFYDQMLEEDREPDQDNAYDSAFAYAGLRNVADVFKRPKVCHLAEDRSEVNRLQFFEKIGGAKFMVYQLGAANPNRSYPAALGDEFIRAFLAEYRDWHVVVVGLDKEGNEIAKLRRVLNDGGGRAHNLVNGLKGFRSLIPIVHNAGLVVCPDSSIGHLAAAFPEVPVISLWGPFAPADRAKYYENHYPIFPQAMCPHAPCHNHEFTLPDKLCRAATNATPGKQVACNVLRAITPEMIMEQARELIKREDAKEAKL